MLWNAPYLASSCFCEGRGVCLLAAKVCEGHTALLHTLQIKLSLVSCSRFA